MGLTMAERKAVTAELANNYRGATKKAKSEILDHLCAVTGWNRDHARRALRAATEQPPRDRRRPLRHPIYGEDVLGALKKIWATLDGPCGKRLAPFLKDIVEAMQRAGELELSSAQRQLLVGMSAATIDRRLAADRRRLPGKTRGSTKPGSMLKGQIPIRTFADWDEARPGFVECDLVAHDGGSNAGEFCQTLDVTDVATGWTELRAVRSKAQRFVFDAIVEIQHRLPFELLGIDSDNGCEFINRELLEYCVEQEITFTRSRPYRKNDGCFVEQKNWTVVRHAVGYLRHDTTEELAVLNELYDHLSLHVNFFQPQMKLVSKVRDGAKVKKRYDTAQTPFQRLLRSDIPAAAKQELTEQYQALNPVQLKRDIIKHQDRLMKLARHKARDLRLREGVFPVRSRASSVRQRKGVSRAS